MNPTALLPTAPAAPAVPATTAPTARPRAATSDERPWGSWHVLDVDHGYKVKRLHVRPGARLSSQSHRHRSELWIVVFGVATCTVDGETTQVGPGGTVVVPCGGQHRLANQGDEELVLVEVQLGAYTGEDDITRYEDDYGRSAPVTVTGS